MRQLSFESLFQGSLQSYPASDASQSLAHWARQIVDQEFSKTPLELSDKEFQRALAQARERVASEEGRRLVFELLDTFDIAMGDLLLDVPRLRAVAPGLEHVKDAAPVFYAHRDTWYGNPRSQINGWIPLQRVSGDDSFRFFLDHFGLPIENDSQDFDASRFAGEGGFGRTQAAVDSVYPRAHSQPLGQTWDVKLESDELLFFSAAHLHQTLPNRTKDVRFSLDFRFFREQDRESGAGAPDPDNRSKGLMTSGYRGFL